MLILFTIIILAAVLEVALEEDGFVFFMVGGFMVFIYLFFVGWVWLGEPTPVNTSIEETEEGYLVETTDRACPTDISNWLVFNFCKPNPPPDVELLLNEDGLPLTIDSKK